MVVSRPVAALDALLFDIGGTLDGRGGWRVRFHRLLPDAGITASPSDRDAAFDYAETRSHAAGQMATARLREMVQLHVGWQLEALGVSEGAAARHVVDRFVREVEDAAAANRRLLAQLVEQGLRLGAVSNACGNAATLCDEYGYGNLLSFVVDSHRFGAAKPDLSIFRHALALAGTRADRTGFVGDSLDRDIEPARALGMRTFWIPYRTPPSRPAAADVMLDSLAGLPEALLQFDLRPV